MSLRNLNMFNLNHGHTESVSEGSEELVDEIFNIEQFPNYVKMYQ